MPDAPTVATIAELAGQLAHLDMDSQAIQHEYDPAYTPWFVRSEQWKLECSLSLLKEHTRLADALTSLAESMATLANR